MLWEHYTHVHLLNLPAAWFYRLGLPASILQTDTETSHFRQWSEGAIVQLQGSFACTDIFVGDLEFFTDYIRFCMGSTIPIKTVKRFSNSKSWNTCKALLETLLILEQVHSTPFTVEDVCQQLRWCKQAKVPGPGSIHARVRVPLTLGWSKTVPLSSPLSYTSFSLNHIELLQCLR